jgi:hypothetical protein
MKNMMAKLLFIPLAALIFTGCVAVDDAGADVTQKFEEGISGRGRIVSPDPMADSYGSYYQ